MLKYILKRLAYLAVTVWVIITATFFLMNTLPGDPVQTGTRILPEQVAENIRIKWGLDKPVMERYFVYMGNLAKGDLGQSMKTIGVDAKKIIVEFFPNSARLGGQALALGLAIGVTLGAISAYKRGTIVDYLVIFVAIVGVSVPSFVLASFLQKTLGGRFFPIIGWPRPGDGLAGIKYTVLPTIAASFGSIAVYSRYMRTSMLDVMHSDHILTAKAKGLSGSRIFTRHIARNSAMPLITIFAPQLSGIVTGSFVLEKIFGIPGLGKYYVDCITNRDYPMIMATTIFFSTIFVASIVLMDILYVLVDPRVRLIENS